MKLAAELARPDTGQTLYLLDEPTTGLHFEDLARLLDVLNRLVDLGNTVVVIEHNLDVIKTADWMIDMGPEAGEGGGHVVVAGPPEQVVAHAQAAARSRGKTTRGESSAGAKATRGARSKTDHAAESQLRSHTGEMLGPVLEAGPHVERKLYDFAARRPGEKKIWILRTSAAKPTCRGKPTVAAGTLAIAWVVRVSPAGGMARSWPP